MILTTIQQIFSVCAWCGWECWWETELWLYVDITTIVSIMDRVDCAFNFDHWIHTPVEFSVLNLLSVEARRYFFFYFIAGERFYLDTLRIFADRKDYWSWKDLYLRNSEKKEKLCAICGLQWKIGGIYAKKISERNQVDCGSEIIKWSCWIELSKYQIFKKWSSKSNTR